MSGPIGKLAHFLVGVPGHYRANEEASFPWHIDDQSVWYALLVVESGKIARYGFTASVAGKSAMVNALRALDQTDESLLLGVWHGTHSTHLFELGRTEAIEYLVGAKRFARFEHFTGVSEVELVFRKGKRRKAFSHLSFRYTAGECQATRSTASHSEAMDLIAFFKTKGIPIRETVAP